MAMSTTNIVLIVARRRVPGAVPDAPPARLGRGRRVATVARRCPCASQGMCDRWPGGLCIGCRAHRCGGGAHSRVGLRGTRRRGSRRGSCKPGEPSATSTIPTRPAPHHRRCPDYMRKSARCSRGRAEEQPAADGRIEQPRRWRGRCCCSRCTRAPRTIGCVAAAYRRPACSTTPTATFSGPSVLDACDAAVLRRAGAHLARLGLPGPRAERRASRAATAPASAALHNTLGTVLRRSGQPDGAERAYRSARSRSTRAPPTPSTICATSSCRRATASRRAASASAALALDPELAAARNNLALVYARAGDLAARGEASAPANGERRAALQHRHRAPARAAICRRGARVRQAAAAQPSLTIARQRRVQARQAARAAEQDTMITAERRASLRASGAEDARGGRAVARPDDAARAQDAALRRRADRHRAGRRLGLRFRHRTGRRRSSSSSITARSRRRARQRLRTGTASPTPAARGRCCSSSRTTTSASRRCRSRSIARYMNAFKPRRRTGRPARVRQAFSHLVISDACSTSSGPPSTPATRCSSTARPATARPSSRRRFTSCSTATSPSRTRSKSRAASSGSSTR